MVASIVKTINLTKIYGKKEKTALENVSLEIGGQGVFTILGRNGAGKTTFLRIIGTQLMPTSGKAYVLGYDVISEVNRVRENIAVMPQEGSTLPPLTPWDHVYYTLIVKGFSKVEAKRAASEALDKLGLTDYRNTHADRLSGGFRQRTLVAIAMSSNARLLLLDEPTLGLDPISRRNVWKVIREYCRNKGSVILTTHYLEEAEVLSDDIMILNEGKVIARGNVDALKKIIKEKVKVEVGDGLSDEELSSFGRTVIVGSRLRVLTDERSAQELVNLAIKKGIRTQISPITLDDAFIELAEEGE